MCKSWDGREKPEGNASYGTAPATLMLSEKEFRAIRDIVYKHFGITLTDRKRSLIIGRLQKLLHERGFKSFRQYCEYLLADATGEALLELASRISTNHTFFNREKVHFDYFTAKALPQAAAGLKAAGSRDLRVWSAGCSTGEEPYMLVMLMIEYFGNEYGMWDAGALATDISETALATAGKGIYSGERMALVPSALKSKYFVDLHNGEWAVSDRVRREVTFRRFNLMNERFPFKKPFHVIFCRNVMIYFDQVTRDRLVQRFFDATVQGGYLFIGHAETLGRGRSPYQYIMPAVYRKGWD